LDRGELDLEDTRAFPKRHWNAGSLYRVREYGSGHSLVDLFFVVIGKPD